MKSETSTNKAELTEDVMQDVLQAEANARKTINACEQDAQQQLEAARQSAHRISERANLRITRIHKISQELISTKVSLIEEMIHKEHIVQPLHLDGDKQQKILLEIAELLTEK